MTKIAEKTKSILAEFLNHFDTKANIDVTEQTNGELYVEITGGDLSFLIGYRGQSLDALNDLLRQMVFKQVNEWPNLMLDINGYNKQRIDRLHNLAKRFVDRVRFFQTEVELPVLNAWERKQIHTYITDYDDVESESKGEGKLRKMYLRPKQHKTAK